MNVKRMATSVIALMLVVTLFGVTGAMADGQDDYGTQVVMCDVDDTYRLINLPGAQIVYVDANTNGICDMLEAVYLDVDGTLTVVSPLDIRLSGAQAGSQVIQGDGDVGNGPLAVSWGGLFGVQYWDTPPVNGLFDVSDPVYLDMVAPGLTVSVNDVRLTTWMGTLPGNRVLGTDTDVGNGLAWPPNSQVKFYDRDGNGIYNAGDQVVFDAQLTTLIPPAFGLGSVNDIRLTPFAGCGVTYKYGTQITAPSLDVVESLGTPIATGGQNDPFVLRWVDRSGNGYTADDWVYAHCTLNPPLVVSRGDVRLTQVLTSSSTAAGTQVMSATDPDMGLPFAPPLLPAMANIRFYDIKGDGYTLNDPVYFDWDGAGGNWEVSIPDVILSAGTPNSGAGIPGSKVNAGSLYRGQALTAMPSPGGAFTRIDYFDVNGDGVYWNGVTSGVGDYVFLDVGNQQYASANDVRLTGPTFSYSFGSKVDPTDSDSVDALVALPAGGIVSWDISNDGFDDADPVYLTTTGTGIVCANDVRLTPLNHGGQSYLAGTVVEAGDVDETANYNWIPWNQVRFYDNNSDGFTPGDPILVDTMGDNMISALDVRLTPYSGHVAGSKVRNDGSDPYYSQPLTTLPLRAAGYYDVNDRQYDGKDYVYMDLFGDGFVTVNDIRLTGDALVSPPPCIGDLNGDNVRNFADVLLMIPYWGGPCSGPEDLNGDGDVNFQDVLDVLIPVWGTSCT